MNYYNYWEEICAIEHKCKQDIIQLLEILGRVELNETKSIFIYDSNGGIFNFELKSIYIENDIVFVEDENFEHRTLNEVADFQTTFIYELLFNIYKTKNY